MQILKGLLLPILTLLPLLSASGQIVADGEKPIGLKGGLRSAYSLPHAVAGHFDQDSARLAIERANSQNTLLRSYLFAQKELVRADLIQEGHHFTEAGREVWQYRVTSEGAESLNFYFSDFYLPQGGLLSVYSVSDPGTVIGPFGADNNSQSGTLSTVPIPADDVVIEVSVPRGATLPRMTLEEVNTGLLNLQSKFDQEAYSCTPDAACMPQTADLVRSVVMIITDGISIGTGTLVNNGKADGTPYILTASHVMNWNFNHMDYDRRASKTVAVFNYHSPICGAGIVPSVNQAVSGATMVGVDETTDIALIKLDTPPPASYRVYYAGWNATGENSGPYMNLHHPGAQPTRYNQFDGDLTMTSFPDGSLPFGKDLFYKVARWTIGTTAPVSSGSPLVGSDKRIIGTLTGGDSYCGPVGSDYFSSLRELWERGSVSDNALGIITALTSGDTSLRTLRGREATGGALPATTRVSHISLTETPDGNILDDLGQVPAEALRSYTRVAERYDLNAGATLHGVYLLFHVQSSASVTSATTPLTLTILHAVNGNKIAEMTVPVEQLTSPSDTETLREIFVPLPEPHTSQTTEPLYFSLNTSGFPSGAVIASQRSQAGTAFGDQGGSFAEIAPPAALWVDLLLSDKQLENAAAPFVQITSAGENYLVLSFDPDYASETGFLNIYTILGQPVARMPISGSYLLIPRSNVAGLGILLFKIRLGDRTETLRLLIEK